MNNLATFGTLSAPRDGGAVSATASFDLQLCADAPIVFDLHWTRSVVGSLLGTTGIRIDTAKPAAVSISLSRRCLATARYQKRGGDAWLRLTLEGCPGSPTASGPSVHVEFPEVTQDDPLRYALDGEHPRQRFRKLLKTLGGVAYGTFLRQSGLGSLQIATLAAHWPALTTSAEPILWHARRDPQLMAGIAAATIWLAKECPSPAALRDRLAPAAGPSASLSERLIRHWLEALTCSTGAATLSGPDYDAARLAAQACLPLLRVPNLAALLNQASHHLPETRPLTSGAALHLLRRLYAATAAHLAGAIADDLASPAKPLVDASFRAGPAGLDLYSQTLAGDLDALLDPDPALVELHDSTLPSALLRRRFQEIHLPFLFSTSREDESTALTLTEIVPGTDGSLNVIRAGASRGDSPAAIHTARQSRMIIASGLSAADQEPANDNYCLGFSDARTILPGQDAQCYFDAIASYGFPRPARPVTPLHASLRLSLPGSLTHAWTKVILSRSESYGPALCAVSLALQACLRRWLPLLAPTGPERYANPASAFPLLVYQYSRPFARVRRGLYSYDTLSADAVQTAIRSARTRLGPALTRIHALLIAAGNPELAAQYSPACAKAIIRTVLLQRRTFATLLAADTAIVEHVFSLARYNRGLTTSAARTPRRAARELHVLATEFSTVLNRRLARFHGGLDFTPIGPLLLLEATAALTGRRDAIRANLTFEPNRGA